MKCVFSLGTNIGDRNDNLERAISTLSLLVGNLTIRSAIFQSEPWGGIDHDEYYNQIIALDTKLSILEIKILIRQIEKELGRNHEDAKWSPRIIDVDLIYYGSEIFSSEDFHVPHKLMHLRNFVLLPLSEILPAFVHPVFNKTSIELLNNCPDELKLVKINEPRAQ